MSPPTCRSRRTKAEMAEIRDRILEIAEQDQPVTIRQLFYRLVSAGVIEKTENEYKSTVVRLCGAMRKAGQLPWDWVADNTRWMRKPRTFGSATAALIATARTYRRSLWANASDYVEVWLEKEALAGVLYDATEEWDVPLMVARGYSSLTFLHSSAVHFPCDRCTYIYYFGDFDPSGVNIAQTVERQLREFADPEVEIHFDRVAVTEEQVTELDLPLRPTKRTDSRAKGWKGGSVEVDAIPPSTLRELCEARIREHVDQEQLRVLLEIEDSERRLLGELAVESL